MQLTRRYVDASSMRCRLSTTASNSPTQMADNGDYILRVFHSDLFDTSAWVTLILHFAEQICSLVKHLHASAWMRPNLKRGVILPQRPPYYSPPAITGQPTYSAVAHSSLSLRKLSNHVYKHNHIFPCTPTHAQHSHFHSQIHRNILRI